MPEQPGQELARVGNHRCIHLCQLAHNRFNGVAGNLPQHGDQRLVERVRRSVAYSLEDGSIMPLMQPPVRPTPLERQSHRLLGKVVGCLVPEEPRVAALNPFRRYVQEESETWRDDRAVLSPAPTVQPERFVEKSQELRGPCRFGEIPWRRDGTSLQAPWCMAD